MIFQFHRCPLTGVGPPPGIEIVSVGYIRGGSSVEPCACASCIASDRLSAYYKTALGLPDGGPGAVYIQDCLQGLNMGHLVGAPPEEVFVESVQGIPACRLLSCAHPL